MWNVQILPVLSTFQRSARSPTTASFGPSRTRPLNTRATRSRSAWVRAVSGLIDVGLETTPWRSTGVPSDASVEPVGAGDPPLSVGELGTPEAAGTDRSEERRV